MHIVDTNTVIYYFKGMGQVAQRLLARSPSEVMIPAIVLYELEVGTLRSSSPGKRRNQLKEFLEYVGVVPFGEAEAIAAAKLRSDLEDDGIGIGPLDTLIAGTALANSAVLVTHNVEEFSRVKELRIEDWF
jgi:tRNA(fMet)-specific endonuclease VapC